MNRETTGNSSCGLRIDFHVHLGVYEPQKPWVADWIKQSQPDPEKYEAYIRRYSDPGAFEELLAAEGVDYACVLAELCPVSTGICSNESVEAFCKGRKRLIPFCSVNPYLTTDLGSELRRLVETAGFRGLKLYPSYQHYYLNEPRVYPLYQAAQDLGIPVLIHTGSSVFKGTRIKFAEPLHLDDVASDFPSLNLVMAHSGRGFWYDQAFFLSKLHSNIYMEVSGLPPSKLMTYFPELARNTDKVIFGSDWPGASQIRRNMEGIAGLPLPADGVDKILGGNAARLLNL